MVKKIGGKKFGQFGKSLLIRQSFFANFLVFVA